MSHMQGLPDLDPSVHKTVDLLVVNDFLDIFPEEDLNLPLPREVEFSKDLVSRAGPVSIAPNQMTPKN